MPTVPYSKKQDDEDVPGLNIESAFTEQDVDDRLLERSGLRRPKNKTVQPQPLPEKDTPSWKSNLLPGQKLPTDIPFKDIPESKKWLRPIADEDLEKSTADLLSTGTLVAGKAFVLGADDKESEIRINRMMEERDLVERAKKNRIPTPTPTAAPTLSPTTQPIPAYEMPKQADVNTDVQEEPANWALGEQARKAVIPKPSDIPAPKVPTVAPTLTKDLGEPGTNTNTNVTSAKLFDLEFDVNQPKPKEVPWRNKFFSKSWKDDDEFQESPIKINKNYYKPKGKTKEVDAPEMVYPFVSDKAIFTSPPKIKRIINGVEDAHHGADIAIKRGTKVVPTMDGEVEFTGYVKGYGNTIVIWHPKRRVYSLYAHLDKNGILVQRGDKVTRGISHIGRSGNTGARSRGPHLHLEIIKEDGEVLNSSQLIEESERKYLESKGKEQNRQITTHGPGRGPSSTGIFLSDEELQASTKEMLDRGVDVAILGGGDDSPIIRSMYDDKSSLEGRLNTSERELLNSLSATKQWLKDLPPEQASKLLKLSKETGINPKLLQGREAEVEAQLKADKFDVDKFVSNFPNLADMIDKDPYLYPMIKDEMSYFGKLGIKFKEGQQAADDLVSEGELGSKLMWNGSLTAAEQEQLKVLEARNKKRAKSQKDETTSDWLAREQGYSINNMISSIKEVADDVAKGAALGLGAGALTGPGAIGGAMLGAGAGAAKGAFEHTFKLESGHAYLEAIRPDENGQKLDHESAKEVAIVVGALNGAIEVFGEGMVIKAIPGLKNIKKQATRATIKKLQSQAFRESIKKASKLIALGQIQEGVTEFVQSLVGSYSTQAQKERMGKADKGSIRSLDFAGKAIGQAVEEGKSAVVGLAGSAPIVGGSVAIDVNSQLRSAAKSDHVINTMHEISKKSKLGTTNPEAAEVVYQKVMEESTGVDKVVVDVEDFNAFFQETEFDGEKVKPEDGAAELVDGGKDAYAKALEEGRPLVIKSGKILSKAAQKKEFAALLLKTRAIDTPMTMKQLEKHAKSQEKLITDRGPIGEVYTDMYNKLINTKIYDPFTSAQLADVFSRNIENLARLTIKEDGTSMTAKEYYDANPVDLSVSGDLMGKDALLQEVAKEMPTIKYGLIEKIKSASKKDYSQSDVKAMGKVVEAYGISDKLPKDKKISKEDLLKLLDENKPEVEITKYLKEKYKYRRKGIEEDHPGVVKRMEDAKSIVIDEYAILVGKLGDKIQSATGAKLNTRDEFSISSYGVSYGDISIVTDDLLEENKKQIESELKAIADAETISGKINLALKSNALLSAISKHKLFPSSISDAKIGLIEKLSPLKTAYIENGFIDKLYEVESKILKFSSYGEYSVNKDYENTFTIGIHQKDLAAKSHVFDRTKEGFGTLVWSRITDMGDGVWFVNEIQTDRKEGILSEKDKYAKLAIESVIADASKAGVKTLLFPSAAQQEGIQKLSGMSWESRKKGMELFYDNVVPKILLKIGEETGLDTSPYSVSLETEESKLAASKIVATLYQESANKALGATVFTPESTSIILDKDATPFTFIHEMGHALLEKWASARTNLTGKEDLNDFQKDFLSKSDDLAKYLSDYNHKKAFEDLKKEAARVSAQASLDKNKDNTAMQYKAKVLQDAVKYVYDRGGESFMEQAASSLGQIIDNKDVYVSIMRPYHEKLARSYEKYLATGEAPSKSLKDVFVDMANWAIQIYKNLKTLKFELPQQVKSFFDTMLLLEGEADKSMSQADLGQSYIDQLSQTMGLNDKQKGTIQKAAEKARRGVYEKMLIEANKEYSTLVELMQSEHRDAIEEQVKKELDEDRMFRIHSVLATGNLPSGTAVPGVLKINRSSMNPKDVKSLPASMFVNENGADIDEISESYGFNTPEEFVKALQAVPPIKKEIQNRTDAVMAQKFNEALIKKEINTQAEEWVYNEEAPRVMRMEIAYMMENAKPAVKELIRQLGRSPRNEELQAQAKSELASTPVGQIDLRVYKGLEQKNRYEAATALAKGDIEAFAKAKDRQILGFYLYKEALEAKKTIKRAKVLFKLVTMPQAEFKNSRQIGAIAAAKMILRHHDVLGSIDDANDILSKLSDIDKKEAKEVLSDYEFYTQSAPSKNVFDLSLDDFSYLFDEVNNLYKLSKSNRDVIIQNQKMDIAVAVESVNESLQKYNMVDYSDVSRLKSGMLAAKSFGRIYRQWVATVSGKDINSVTFNALFGNIDQANNDRLTLTRETVDVVQVELKKLVGVLSTEKIVANNIIVDGKKAVFNGQLHLLGMILHMGNESSRQKYIVGNKFGTYGDYEAFEGFLRESIANGNITEQMLDFAQLVWDTYDNNLKDKTQKAHYDKYGTFHGEIRENSFEAFGKTYRGGYAPIRFDRKRAAEFGVLDMPEEDQFKYILPYVNSKFALKRSMKPIPVSDNYMDIIPAMNAHVRFATMTKAIDDTRKIVTNPSVMANINRIDPHAMNNMIMPYLNRASTGRMSPESTNVFFVRLLNPAIGFILRRFAVTRLALNFVNIAEEFGGRLLSSANMSAPSFRNTPYWVTNDHIEFAKSKSEKLRASIDKYMDDTNMFHSSIFKEGSTLRTLSDLNDKGSFWMQHKITTYNRVAQFYGKYMDVLEETGDEKRAAKEADHMVATVYGYHQPTEVSSLVAAPPLVKAIGFMFTSFFNNKANMMATEISDMKYNPEEGKSVSVRAANLILFSILADAIISYTLRTYLKGSSKDEDDDGSEMDDHIKGLLLAVGGSIAALTPPTGIAYRAIISKADKTPINDKVGVSPFDSPLNDTSKSPFILKKAMEKGVESLTNSEVDTLLSAITFGTGVSVYGAKKSRDYLKQVLGMEEEQSGKTNKTDRVVW